MIDRDAVPRLVAELVGRPARWAPAGLCVGDYEGRERTLEVFDAEASEQLRLLRQIRAERRDLEHAAGGPLVVLFHTPGETRRLYGEVLRGQPGRDRYRDLAETVGQWIRADHDADTAVEPGEVEPFTIGDAEAALP